MTPKTDRQRLLESQRQRPIEEIVVETLNRNRGQRNCNTLSAAELGVSPTTLYAWRAQLRIDPQPYRRNGSHCADVR